MGLFYLFRWADKTVGHGFLGLAETRHSGISILPFHLKLSRLWIMGTDLQTDWCR